MFRDERERKKNTYVKQHCKIFLLCIPHNFWIAFFHSFMNVLTFFDWTENQSHTLFAHTTIIKTRLDSNEIQNGNHNHNSIWKKEKTNSNAYTDKSIFYTFFRRKWSISNNRQKPNWKRTEKRHMNWAHKDFSCFFFFLSLHICIFCAYFGLSLFFFPRLFLRFILSLSFFMLLMYSLDLRVEIKLKLKANRQRQVQKCWLHMRHLCEKEKNIRENYCWCFKNRMISKNTNKHSIITI